MYTKYNDIDIRITIKYPIRDTIAFVRSKDDRKNDMEGNKTENSVSPAVKVFLRLRVKTGTCDYCTVLFQGNSTLTITMYSCPPTRIKVEEFRNVNKSVKILPM